MAVIVSGTVSAQELPRGEIVDDVQCQQDASQRYALYLPSYFSPSRQWPVILAFDGGGRGRQGVERYRAAAEKYGYVVAGSNNSHNGPWNVGLDAAAAMTADIKRRFPIDLKRMYTAGMSGGARVAIMLAQNSPEITEATGRTADRSDQPPEIVYSPNLTNRAVHNHVPHVLISLVSCATAADIDGSVSPFCDS